MKIIQVTYDKTRPELMDRIAEHWKAYVTIARKKRMHDAILREWRAGNTRLLMYEEVIECLTNL